MVSGRRNAISPRAQGHQTLPTRERERYIKKER